MTEPQKTKQAVKFFLIILTSTLFAVVLHQLHHDPLMTLGTKSRSIIVTSGWFPFAASVSLAVTFGIMGLMFLSIQKGLPGKGPHKGALYGVALGGMYVVGMIETYVVYPVSLFGEVYTGMADGGGILLMSLLLGRYLADDTPFNDREKHPALPSILLIPTIYVLFRYFSYAILQIESSYSTKPIATLAWTAGMGGWIAVMYLAIGRTVWRENPLKNALGFGGIIFGINWVIFALFALLFIQVPVIDLLCRSVVDTIAVMVAIHLSSLFGNKPGATRQR